MDPPVKPSEAADRAGEAAFAEALEFTAQVRRDPKLLSSRLPILYERLDAFHAEALRGAEIECKAGCSRCCSQWVPGVKAFEIERIAAFVRDCRERDEIVAGLRSRLATHDAIPDPDRDLAYARLAIPCVFLTSEGTCGIRPIRPETCRSFFSFGPSERCAGDPDSTGFVLTPHASFDDVLARAEAPFDRRGSYTGELIRDLLDRL